MTVNTHIFFFWPYQSLLEVWLGVHSCRNVVKFNIVKHDVLLLFYLLKSVLIRNPQVQVILGIEYYLRI